MIMSSNGNIFRVTILGEFPTQRLVTRGALMFYLICVWINSWVNNRKVGDLRRYAAHYDVIVMKRLGPFTIYGKRTSNATSVSVSSCWHTAVTAGNVFDPSLLDPTLCIEIHPVINIPIKTTIVLWIWECVAGKRLKWKLSSNCCIKCWKYEW